MSFGFDGIDRWLSKLLFVHTLILYRSIPLVFSNRKKEKRSDGKCLKKKISIFKDGVLPLKRRLMDILACPIDKHHPLELYVFEEKEEIVEGIIVCPKCNRFYPIKDEIPEMLPDELRNAEEDIRFLKKWEKVVPEKILKDGKPFNLSEEPEKRKS